MRNLTEGNLTEAVLAKLEGATDARFKQIMTSLVKHLHGFLREVELTEQEWMTAIQFLTATGQKCDDKRQEYILLVGHARRFDAGGRDEPPQALRRDRVYRAGAVLRAGSAGTADRRQHRGGRGRRAHLFFGAGFAPPMASRSPGRRWTCGLPTARAGTTCS